MKVKDSDPSLTRLSIPDFPVSSITPRRVTPTRLCPVLQCSNGLQWVIDILILRPGIQDQVVCKGGGDPVEDPLSYMNQYEERNRRMDRVTTLCPEERPSGCKTVSLYFILNTGGVRRGDDTDFATLRVWTREGERENLKICPFTLYTLDKPELVL